MDKEKKLYKSPYESYPFLSDSSNDLRCDFELLTDEMSSHTGLLRSLVKDESIRADLLTICELIYHMNPTLRTKMTITNEEITWLLNKTEELNSQVHDRFDKFVLTQGSTAASHAHILRVKGKSSVRMLYRHIQNGHIVPNTLIDFANLLSGYFFLLALRLNELDGVDEIPYISRNYL